MFRWFKTLFYIVKNYHADLALIAEHVDGVTQNMEASARFIKRATKVHIDLPASAEDATTVIVCGQYRGKDYVRTFGVKHNNVEELVQWLHGMQEQFTIGRVDVPGDIDATVKRELHDKQIITL